VRLLGKVRNRLERARRHRWRMGAWASPERHVIIGGCPRSGTTLLRRTFDRHPGLCCGPESSLFLPARIALAPLAATHGMDEAEVRALLRESRSQAAFIDAFAARYRALRGRPRWVEKTPLNIRQIGWILERFPEARVIHVIRDGRDVVCSLRDHPDRRWVDGAWVKELNPRSIEEHARRWVADTGAGMAWRADPRVLEVRYEDLAREPERTLRRVLAFLGEPYDPALLAAEEGREAAAGPGRPDAAGPIVTGSIGRWRSDLSPAEQEVVRRVAGQRLMELGYADDGAW